MPKLSGWPEPLSGRRSGKPQSAGRLPVPPPRRADDRPNSANATYSFTVAVQEISIVYPRALLAISVVF
jgi:hypothetical protein